MCFYGLNSWWQQVERYWLGLNFIDFNCCHWYVETSPTKSTRKSCKCKESNLIPEIYEVHILRLFRTPPFWIPKKRSLCSVRYKVIAEMAQEPEWGWSPMEVRVFIRLLQLHLNPRRPSVFQLAGGFADSSCSSAGTVWHREWSKCLRRKCDWYVDVCVAGWCGRQQMCHRSLTWRPRIKDSVAVCLSFTNTQILQLL